MIPLLLLALAFLVAYAWPILDPRLDHDLATFLLVLTWTVWGAFAVDLVIRLVLADQRLEYAARHWYDVVLAHPDASTAPPPPTARVRPHPRTIRDPEPRRTGNALRHWICSRRRRLGALAILDAERDAAGANITTFGDALWWAATTVMTVGYGDRYPGDDRGSVRCRHPHGCWYRGRGIARPAAVTG